MNILLETTEVWEFDEVFTVHGFFEALHLLCRPDDILVIGSYDPPVVVDEWLVEHSLFTPRRASKLPFDFRCFAVNRRLNLHPRGRVYAIAPGRAQLRRLAAFGRQFDGGQRRLTFFDHILCYRAGVPTVPLFDYHDAFFCGRLQLSGHYSQQLVDKFARQLHTVAHRTNNPELAFMDRKFQEKTECKLDAAI